MPPLVVPNTVQARLIWASGTPPRRQVTVLHGTVPTDWVMGDHTADMAAAIGTAATTAAIKPKWVTDHALTALELTDIRTDEIREGSAAVSGVVGTALASSRLPRDVQLCVTLRTNRKGRSYRGRVFLTGFGTTANASGVCDAATMTAADTFIEQIRALWAAEDFILGVCSRKLLETNTVGSILVRDANWDTLRRRDP